MNGLSVEHLCSAFAAFNTLLLGYPDQAMTLGRESLALAESVADPHVLALAREYWALLQRWVRDVDEAATASL
jgi:hypothetical protein